MERKEKSVLLYFHLPAPIVPEATGNAWTELHVRLMLCLQESTRHTVGKECRLEDGAVSVCAQKWHRGPTAEMITQGLTAFSKTIAGHQELSVDLH